jgi:hypothetical protein
MYLCILDGAGQVVYDKNLTADPNAFLKAVAPFRDGLVVAVECLFCWYWLADLCAKEQIASVSARSWQRAGCRTLKMCLVQLRAETPSRTAPLQPARKRSTAIRELCVRKKKFFRFRGAPC